MKRSEFDERNARMIALQSVGLQDTAKTWYHSASLYDYAYRFTWQGVPMLQHPCDVMALQEIIFATKPDLIIETGVAWGGSLLFYASMMQLLGNQGAVLGIEIGILPEVKTALIDRIKGREVLLFKGSSTDTESIEATTVLQKLMHSQAYGPCRTMVVLDSNHTHEHVLAELHAYAPMVTPGCYLVVMDTIIQHMPEPFSANKPWGPGNNPATAVEEFMQTTDRFEVDAAMDAKLLVSAAPGGWLRCIA